MIDILTAIHHWRRHVDFWVVIIIGSCFCIICRYYVHVIMLSLAFNAAVFRMQCLIRFVSMEGGGGKFLVVEGPTVCKVSYSTDVSSISLSMWQVQRYPVQLCCGDHLQLPSSGIETHSTSSQHEYSFGSWKGYRFLSHRLLQLPAIWDI